jgi:hypothetical protein
MVDRLPGVEADDVYAIHDVLAGRAVGLGRRVLVLDDLGDWRGVGTALALAEAGHEVTVLTAAPVIAGGLFHSAADVPLRNRFARAGGRARTGVAVLAWRDGFATVRTLIDGATEEIEADALVVAETPAPEDSLAAELAAAGGTFRQIGDCVSARRASLAFYEGRELGGRL